MIINTDFIFIFFKEGIIGFDFSEMFFDIVIFYIITSFEYFINKNTKV